MSTTATNVTNVPTPSADAIPIDEIKMQIRNLISNVYDLQKLRIAAGNRLIQSFYSQLGVKPSESPDDLTGDAKNLLDAIRKEYEMISEVATEIAGDKDAKMSTVKKAIRLINEGTFEDKVLKSIRNDVDFRLVKSYNLMVESEKEATDALDKIVKSHPLWDKFFSKIKGCGTLMSAVCIAYFDPYKARHASSFLKYCGLDTVQDKDKDGRPLYLIKMGTVVTDRKVYQKFTYTDEDGNPYTGEVERTGEYDDVTGLEIIRGKNGEYLKEFEEMAMFNGEQVPVYVDVETGKDYVGDVTTSMHARRKGDTEMFEYIDKDGNPAMKRGITYNPVLKTKLMGVLSGCLIKAKDPTYETIYRDYKARLDNRGNTQNYSAGRKNMMALRYMMKMFVRNLWTTWRNLEGLLVDEPYEVAKLGNTPHKYNQYQVDMAKKHGVPTNKD